MVMMNDQVKCFIGVSGSQDRKVRAPLGACPALGGGEVCGGLAHRGRLPNAQG